MGKCEHCGGGEAAKLVCDEGSRTLRDAETGRIREFDLAQARETGGRLLLAVESYGRVAVHALVKKLDHGPYDTTRLVAAAGWQYENDHNPTDRDDLSAVRLGQMRPNASGGNPSRTQSIVLREGNELVVTELWPAMSTDGKRRLSFVDGTSEYPGTIVGIEYVAPESVAVGNELPGAALDVDSDEELVSIA